MRYELFIADRYLRSKQRTGFISIITYISAAGVMIGVAALVIVLYVANGFESEVRSRIIGADSHIKLTLFHGAPMGDYAAVRETVMEIPHVIGGSAFIDGKGMLKSHNRIEGSLIKGIDASTVDEIGDLKETIVAGELTFTPVEILTDSMPNPRALSGIILGKQLSFRLGATTGDTIIAISPLNMTSLFSSPQVMKFVVTGIFERGIFEYDDTYSYISIEAAQKLFELGSTVTGIEFKLDDLNRADLVRVAIDETLHYPYFTRTWFDLHSNLFRWMKMEKWMFTILLSLIITVAAFNIISSQIMMVLEKKREIGILKALGVTSKGIQRIFLYEGLIIGVTGTIAGLILGYAVCWGQIYFEWFSLPGDVYFLSVLPVKMQIIDFIIIAFVSLCLAVIASVYPSRWAGKLEPVDAIRYE